MDKKNEKEKTLSVKKHFNARNATHGSTDVRQGSLSPSHPSPPLLFSFLPSLDLPFISPDFFNDIFKPKNIF